MPKWYVELYVGQDIVHIGEPFIRKDAQTALTFLSTCLQDDSFKIIIVDNYHFLVSTDFDAFDNEDEVYQYVQNQLPILNGIMQIKFDARICSIKVGDIYHSDTDGCLTRTLVRFPPLKGSVFPSEHSLKSANAQKPNLSDMLFIAKKNPLVAEALQHLAMSHSWYSLEKVFEIVRDYAGQAENDGRLPRGTFDKWTQGRDFGKKASGKSFDFLQTAHSYYWSGLSARHASVGSQKLEGVTPMSLNDAVKYITDIFMKWLQTSP